VMVALAFAIERIVLRQLVNQEHIILFMSTIGLAYFLEGLGDTLWGSNVKKLDIGIPNAPFEWGGVLLNQFELVAAATAAILVAVLAVFFHRTRIGRALRAVADDHQAALSVGISLETIWWIVWSVAGIVALVAGIMWGAKSGVQFSLSLIALKALPVLILGGFTSIPGAIIGGLIIGAGEKLFDFYIGVPYQRLGILAVLGEDGNTQARLHLDIQFIYGKGLRERVLDFLHADGHLVHSRPRQQYRELIPAEPGDGIGLPEHALQARADLPQQ